jgi:hypothetical protein
MPWSSTTSSSENENSWMMDSPFLLKIWRRRDGQLLRLLNAQNLGQIKEEFDMVAKVTGKDGLGAADFVRVMLTLLSIVGSNREELCIQIMELFANIDVNGDRTMEWDEFLNYVVETGYGVQSTHEDNGEAAVSADASVFNRYSYRSITNASLPSSESEELSATAAAMSDASNVFDVISIASVEFDEQTKTVFVLGFRYRGMLVYALRFGQEMQIPVLLPFKRFRHDFAFQSHQVVQAVFINDAGSATGLLKEGSQIVVTCSQEWENGPTHINTFDFVEQVCLKRCKVQQASSVLFYAPSMAKVYSISKEGSEVAFFDVHDACSTVDGRFPMGETMIVCAAPLPGHLSGAMFVGSAEGALSVWDLEKGKAIPGMSLIAHDYGVRALQYCESHSQLVTIGQPHPRRLQGLPEHVYAVLLWGLGPWVTECRDGNALQRAIARQKAVAKLQNAILEATTGAPGRGAAAISSAQAALAALPPPPPSSVTPTQLIGHRFPVTKFSIQVESGTIPHVVSVDEGGQVRVWDMIRATCIQKLALYQAPRLAGLSTSSNPMNETKVKDGDGNANGSYTEHNETTSPSRNSANGRLPAFSPFQKQAVVGLLNEFARKGSTAIDAAGNVGKMLRHGATNNADSSLPGGSGVAGARSIHLSTSSPNNPRHMSYGSAAVTLYPYRGEGAAEKEIRSLGDAGMVDIIQTERSQVPTMSMLSMPSSIFPQASTTSHPHAPHIHNKLADGIVRAGVKYGVGRGGPGGSGDGDDAVLYPSREEADEAVEGLFSRLVPQEELGGNLSYSAASLSTALRLVGIPDTGLLPEISPRRQRALNGGSMNSNKSISSPRSGKKLVGGGVTGTLFAPSLSSDESLMESANTGAKIFKKDLQHQVEKNLRDALGLTGISTIDAGQGIALSKSARKNLLNPIPLASSSTTIDSDTIPSQSISTQNSSSPILGADSNVLSSLMELRLHGRRGSISDFALMLAHEAKRTENGEGGQKRQKQKNVGISTTESSITDESGRKRKVDDSSAEAKMGGSIPEDINQLAITSLGTSNKNTGYPSVVLLLPKSIGGQEERNLMLVGGARAGITKATVRAGGGGLALKHGMRMFSFSQDLPDREPLLGAVFVPPSLHFVTGTISAIVVWDALSGRPIRMYSKNEISDGRDLMCFTLDKRARKIIVGCVKGGLYVLNLQSGAIMKHLDPRSSSPRKAIITAQFESKVRFLAEQKLAEATARLQLSSESMTASPEAVVNVQPLLVDEKLSSSESETIMSDILEQPYEAAISSVSYSPRLEVFSTASDGSVWINEERTSEGWGAGTSNTLMRLVPLPHETYRSSYGDAATPLALLQDERSLQAERDPLLLAAKGSKQFSPLSLQDLAGKNESNATSNSAVAKSISSSVPFEIDAPQSHSTIPIGENEDAELPPLDGSLKVSSVIFSTRLNLIVTCSRILRDIPQSVSEEDDEDDDQVEYGYAEEKKDEGWSETERGGKRATKRRNAQAKDSKSKDSKESHNIIDDDSHIILVWDYTKMTLLGACARSPLDPRSGIGSRVAARANAASLLAKKGTFALLSSVYTGVSSDSPDGYNESNFTSQGGSSFDLANLSSLLLPQTTCMSFLDPLSALVSCHEDGGIRIWAMPPASLPFTMRSIFFVPNNPSLSLYSSEASKSSKPDEARALTNAGNKILSDINEASSVLKGKSELKKNEDETKDNNDIPLHVQKRRRSSIIGGIDLDDVPLLSKRRVASCITSRPALLTDSMHFGSIAPVGHSSMMPFGRVFVKEGAPAVMPNLFFSKGIKPDASEIEKRRTALLEMQLRGDSLPPIPTSSYLSKLNELPAGEEGTVLWLGDMDGEVHRFFLSSAAIAGMGLSNVNFSDTTGDEFHDEDSSNNSHDDLFERHLDETPLSARNAAVALVWSRAQTRLWMARMSKTASAVIQQYRGSDSAVNDVLTENGSETMFNEQSRPVVHPGLLTLFLHPGRFPLFPVIGEAMPPTALKFSAPALPEPPCSFTVTHLPLPLSKKSVTKVDSSKSSTSSSLVSYVEADTLNPRRPICGLIGVVWEGSWRAHVGVDIVSIQAIADSGFHGVLTSGMEGLARIWDANGRLLGTLDAQPRFCAPMPSWEKTGGSLALLLKKQKEKYAKSREDKKNAEAAVSHLRTQSANLDEEITENDFDGDAGKLALSKILATIPKVYGPGVGSGYAFDRYSMSHVCSERVIDARFVHIPPNCSIAPPPENARPLTEEEIALAKLPAWLAKSKAAAGAVKVAPTEPPPPLSSAEAEIMKILPKQWTTNPYTRPSIVPVRLTVHKLPPKDLAFDLLSTANTIPEACGIDAQTAAASRVKVEGKKNVSDIVSYTNYIYMTVLSRREGLSHPRTNNEKGSREFGLSYVALAPPQWQVIWHVTDEINLETRRRAQAEMADIAIDLVKVFKLRALQLGASNDNQQGRDSISSFVKSAMGDELAAKESSLKKRDDKRDEAHPIKKTKLGRLLTGQNESGQSLYEGSISMARLNSHAANQAAQKAKARAAVLDRGDSVVLLSVNSEARIASSMATMGAIQRTNTAGGLFGSLIDSSKLQSKDKAGLSSSEQLLVLSDLPMSEKATSIMQEAHRLAKSKKDMMSPTKSVKISVEVETFHEKDIADVSIRPPSRSQAPPSKSTVKPTRSASEFRIKGNDPRIVPEPTEFEKGMRDDPASVTLMRMDDEIKRDKVLGLDKPFERSVSSIGALSGPAFQNKLRQEKAREENRKRQSAKERARLEHLGVINMDDPEIDIKAKERLLVEEAKLGDTDNIDSSWIKPESGVNGKSIGVGESSAADAITNILFSIAKDKEKLGLVAHEQRKEDLHSSKQTHKRKERDSREETKMPHSPLKSKKTTK